jgi:short-subunit dehydrogenase
MVLWGGRAYPFVLDLSSSTLDPEQVYGYSFERLGHVDALLIPAGYTSSDDNGIVEGPTVETIVRSNYLSVMVVIAKFARAFETQGHGCIVGFTSISAAAPRRRNMIYASAKAGLEVYLHGLRHYISGTNVVIQGYALGYVDSTMTFGQKLWLPAVSPRKVALYVIKNLNRDIGVVYFPRYWRILTLIIRMLPWTVYRRLSF